MPVWFKGAHLQLWFGDVVSEKDATNCKTRAASIEDIQRSVAFVREALMTKGSRVLVCCDYGASRSPALAYIFIADQFGVGREAEAFQLMLDIRPIAVPNGLVVRLGDMVLQRRGALRQPMRDFYAKINAELFPKVA